MLELVKERKDFSGSLDVAMFDTRDHLDALIAFPHSILSNSSTTLRSKIYTLVI